MDNDTEIKTKQWKIHVSSLSDFITFGKFIYSLSDVPKFPILPIMNIVSAIVHRLPKSSVIMLPTLSNVL